MRPCPFDGHPLNPVIGNQFIDWQCLTCHNGFTNEVLDDAAFAPRTPPVSSPTPDEQAAEGVTAEVTAFMCSDDEAERETFVHEVGDFAMNYSTDASPVGVVGTINKPAGEDSCPDCARRMKPWQDREIWPLMNRAEPAMRDELLAAWAVRDEKIEAAAASEAALVVVREQLTQAQAGLAKAWDEGHKAGEEDEARWHEPEKARPDTPNPYQEER